MGIPIASLDGALARLQSQLPAIGASDQPEEQIRAVLSPLVKRALELNPGSSPTARSARSNPLRSGGEESNSKGADEVVAEHPSVELSAALVEDGQEGSPQDPLTCPNCGMPVESERSPYCSPLCRETAAFVRQFRSAVADGKIFDEERQIALGQKWWNLQGGGYPHRQRLVPAKTIAKVIARDGGVCSVCGAPATEIDHTGSG